MAQRSVVLMFVLLSALAFAAVTAAVENDVRYEVDAGGLRRSYVLHLPRGDESRSPLPLVVALHGGGGNARASARQTGFDDEADRDGFVVVHPNGTGETRPLLNAMGKGLFTWNAGTCCGYAKEHGVDDVAFIRAVVRDVERRVAIDGRRVYATGTSNGGMMSYRLACEASDLFAAIGVVAGAQTVAPCRPAHPVSLIHFHGMADENVPFAGGVGRNAWDKAPKPPVMDAIEFWARTDGCRSAAERSKNGVVETVRFTGCREGTEVVLNLIEGGGHSWPGGRRMLAILDPPSDAIAATPTIARFFMAHGR